ncbi:hypothetical protein ES705_36811 [subsurface metagenome]
MNWRKIACRLGFHNITVIALRRVVDKGYCEWCGKYFAFTADGDYFKEIKQEAK